MVHGIGNRDEEEFGRTVDALATAIGGIAARPVFWGDLGAHYEWIKDTVPGAPLALTEVRDFGPDPEGEDLRYLLLGGSAPLGAEVRTEAAVPDPVLQAATETMADRTGSFEEVRGGAD